MEYKLLYSPEKLSPIKSDQVSDTTEQKWEVGNTIENKYEIEDVLSQDENKVIHKVRHCQWNIHLAVRGQLDKDSQVQFFEQAERWVNLEKHPNIVSAYYVKTAEGISRLFVEYVRAKTFNNFFSDSNLDIETIMDVAIQLGWGMDHAHSKGLIHGDLRPGNIFITDDYQVKISDFRLREKVSSYSTYMAPEQFNSKEAPQYTADMYAYGIILYEMCLGEKPFKMEGNLQGKNVNKYKTMVMTQPPRNPHQVLHSIPEQFSKIIMSCVSPNPADRPRNFSSINEKLVELYEEITGFKYPREEPNASELTAIDLNNRALALLDLGEDEKAENYLQQAVDSDPECTGALINLELLRIHKGKSTLAHILSETTHLLEVDPQVVSFYRLKICLEQGGFLEEALEEALHIQNMFPRNKEIIDLKASFLERLGHYKETIEAIQSTLGIEKGTVKDYFHLGKCYLHLNKFKSAQEILEKGLSLFPENNALQIALGVAIAHRGMVKEAQEHFEKMVEKTPDNFWATLQLAEITSATKKYVKAYGKATKNYDIAKDLYQKLWDMGAVPRVRHGYEMVFGHPPQTKGKPVEDISYWRYKRSLEGHKNGVHCMAISPDDRLVVAGGHASEIVVSEVATGKIKNTFKIEGEKVTDLRISTDGHFVISIGDRNIVDVWDLISGENVCKLEGHVLQITCLEITQTGYIATGSADKSIRIWDLGGLVCHKVLKGHSDKILCLAATPDNQRMVSGSEDHNVGMWNIESGECLGILKGHTQAVSCVAVSPNGKFAVSGSWDQQLRVWNIETKECIHVLEGHSGPINTITITFDSKKIISAGEDKNIFVWDLETGQCTKVLEGHTVSVTCLGLMPKSNVVVSGSWDHTLRIWDIESGNCLSLLEGHTDLVNAIAITSDESHIFSGGDDPVLRTWKDVTTEICPYFKEAPLSYLLESPKLYNSGNILEQRLIGKLFSKAQEHIKEGNVARSFELFREIQEMREFEKNNRILEAIASTAIQNNFKRNKTRKIWEAKTFLVHENQISAFAVIEEQDLLAAASYDGTISIWNLEEGKQIYSLKGHENFITSIEISQNGRFLVSGSRDNTIRLWELETGQCIYNLRGHEHWVEKVKFSNDGRKIISGGRDGHVMIWEINSGDRIYDMTNHTDIVNALEVIPNTENIASASHDRSIRLWDSETGSCLHTLERHREHVKCIAAVPNSSYIVSGGWDHVLYLWDTKTGDFAKKFTGHTSWINNISVSNNGKTLLSASIDKTIRVWDIESGKCKGVLDNHTEEVNQIIITPDDRFAISTSNDNTIMIWDIQNCECCDGIKTSEGKITEIIMMEEGRRLVGGSNRGAIIVWEIDWEWEIPYEYGQPKGAEG